MVGDTHAHENYIIGSRVDFLFFFSTGSELQDIIAL